jgi:hypothetical protein
MDGLAQALEKLQSVASAVASATIDDAAQVPGAICEMLKESAAVIGGLANQFAAAPAPAAAAPEAAAAAQPAKAVDDATQKATETRKAELDAYTAMVTTVNAARERIYGAMNCMGTDPSKAVSELQAVGDMLTSAAGAAGGAAPAPTEAAKTAKALKITADVAKRLGAIAEMAKAGRKIKGERFKRLTALRNDFDAILMELGEEEKAVDGVDPAAVAAVTDPAAAPPAAATAKSADPVELVRALGDRLETALKGFGDAVAKASATVSPEIQKQLDANKVLLEKSLKDIATMKRETPGSNQGSPTGGPAADAPQVTWSEDMAAEVVASRNKRGGASAQSNGK